MRKRDDLFVDCATHAISNENDIVPICRQRIADVPGHTLVAKQAGHYSAASSTSPATTSDA